MTPVEIRQTFGETIRAYKAAWPNTDTSCTMARHIMSALKTHPWLLDQIPWDVFDLAKKDAERAI